MFIFVKNVNRLPEVSEQIVADPKAKKDPKKPVSAGKSKMEKTAPETVEVPQFYYSKGDLLEDLSEAVDHFKHLTQLNTEVYLNEAVEGYGHMLVRPFSTLISSADPNNLYENLINL